jgi:hypothetical protein
VTSQQAATLLPLWQAADRLATSGSATTADLEAAFRQIQAAMTADQLQAIQSMDLSGQNMLVLAQKLGIAMPAGQATLTPGQQATMEAGGWDSWPRRAPRRARNADAWRPTGRGGQWQPGCARDGRRFRCDLLSSRD